MCNIPVAGRAPPSGAVDLDEVLDLRERLVQSVADLGVSVLDALGVRAARPGRLRGVAADVELPAVPAVALRTPFDVLALVVDPEPGPALTGLSVHVRGRLDLLRPGAFGPLHPREVLRQVADVGEVLEQYLLAGDDLRRTLEICHGHALPRWAPLRRQPGGVPRPARSAAKASCTRSGSDV